MQIYPAIDLRDGKCVRLKQGDYAQETIFGADPPEMALRWVNDGATYLHLVDLDGAREGRPVNGRSIRAIVKATGIPCQLGGGLRTEDDIKQVLAWGVSRVIVGTRALQSPDWLAKMAERFPGRIALGIDARDGKVATQGWLDVSEIDAFDLARQCARPPLSAIIYTDISRDGMMQGANVAAMSQMKDAVPLPVIASGGVTTLDDVRQLHEKGLAGCIIGRALYEGRLNLGEVFALISEK
ncbi:MAG: 1-(5-phosphoribosyl)-5-[(5-phosphoribosylamino)methylideneamino]imidazole-4-carboxamide isomerase [Planctomycetes bacterium]|nr:1-(5-phosphoribosyl)-5-[(5-phosphoribosylamino)methylideneamino]imidazole-4-carboxamide isomerase [Planctomycetota bacterium]